MSWKKHFRSVTSTPTPNTIPDRNYSPQGSTTSKYSSYLPEVYAGHPNRIQRYYQYDDMDRDSDINAALDTIADFCTQSEEQSDEPFEVKYNGKVTETETKLITKYLEQWIKLQNFRSRLWHTFRNTIKNGDQLFLRDPETLEWLWVDSFMVEMVKVDDTCGKKPEEYIIRGLEYNRQAKFGTIAADPQQYRTPFGTSNAYGGRPLISLSSGGPSAFSLSGNNADPRARNALQGPNNQMYVVDAKHVVHLSLSVGMDINFPFGPSVLEPIFKTFKQKELLEDSVIIYRVQRAPERRVFYIDVGAMPPPRAKAHIEMIKNEIHQRRIPNRTGGGQSVMDAAYNPLCLDMETKIPLLDGRTLTIRELSDEYRSGKENWIYSCDPITGKIVPGNVTWAGVTRESAKVIKITLDNGETLITTPDHKIPVLNKGFVEAQHLTTDDSLIAFNTRKKNIDRKLANERTYEQVYDHSEKEWIYTHRMVGEFFRDMEKHQEFTFLPENRDSVKQTIHHKDYDRYNNDPRNLQYMNKEDHLAYHVAMKKDYWDNLTPEESIRIKTKISNTLREYNAGLTVEQKLALSDFASSRSLRVHSEMKINNPERYNKWMNDSGERIKKTFAPGTEAALNRGRRRVELGGRVLKNQTLQVTPLLDRMIVDLINEKTPSRIEAAELLSNNSTFLEELKNANPSQDGLINKIDYDKISPVKLDLIIEKLGYKGWRDLTRKVANYNHRIVSIEWLDEPMQVGTITVDGKERWHKHHTFATAAGIFVKNSMIEDYFFAQGAEGRGSKVEVLPGGDQTGDITDLSFFSKKLARGLRIPPSYLSIGDDANTVTFNDGKLGAALIQEFRFNKYCMRLQSLLSPVFDREFKYYLEKNGIEIDASVFELRFNPPQNFTKYRQIELDTQQMQVYSQIQDNPRLAERFKLKRFLNLSEDELLENETMFMEENPDWIEKTIGKNPADMNTTQDLSDVGVRSGNSEFGIDGLDDETGETPPGGEGGETPPPGGPTTPGGPGGATGPGGAPDISGGAPPPS